MTKKRNIHYIHYLSQSAKERLVGLFFIISLAVIAGLMINKIQSAKMFDDVIMYHTFMRNAQGISSETLVNISGIDVGKVSAITISDDNRVRIEFFIYKSFAKLIRIDSSGVLSKLSLVGNSVIIITAGNPELPLLTSGSDITIEEPITTDDLVEGILPVINDLDSVASYLADIIAAIEPEDVEASAKSVRVILKNLEQITTDIAEGKGLLGKAIYDEAQADKLSRSLAKTESILMAVEQQVQSITPLVNHLTTLSDSSVALVNEVRASLQKIDQQLEYLPGMVTEAQTLMQSSDETLQGVQKMWPLSTVMPKPNKNISIQEGGLYE